LIIGKCTEERRNPVYDEEWKKVREGILMLEEKGGWINKEDDMRWVKGEEEMSKEVDEMQDQVPVMMHDMPWEDALGMGGEIHDEGGQDVQGGEVHDLEDGAQGDDEQSVVRDEQDGPVEEDGVWEDALGMGSEVHDEGAQDVQGGEVHDLEDGAHCHRETMSKVLYEMSRMIQWWRMVYERIREGAEIEKRGTVKFVCRMMRVARGMIKPMERVVVMDVMMGKLRMIQGGISKFVRGVAGMNMIMEFVLWMMMEVLIWMMMRLSLMR
jgi:hypothetical protein